MRWMRWWPERVSYLPARGAGRPPPGVARAARHYPTGSAGRWPANARPNHDGSAGRWPANARFGYTPASTRWSMKLRTFGARWLRLV